MLYNHILSHKMSVATCTSFIVKLQSVSYEFLFPRLHSTDCPIHSFIMLLLNCLSTSSLATRTVLVLFCPCTQYVSGENISRKVSAETIPLHCLFTSLEIQKERRKRNGTPWFLHVCYMECSSSAFLQPKKSRIDGLLSILDYLYLSLYSSCVSPFITFVSSCFPSKRVNCLFMRPKSIVLPENGRHDQTINQGLRQ
jgi:hypothetical protein